jgi:hypothetical protein
LLSRLFGPRHQPAASTPWDASDADRALRQQQRRLGELMQRVERTMAADGVDADAHPNGFGAFGRVATNPVPCRAGSGARAYLAALRAPDGTPALHERLGTTSSVNIPMPVEVHAMRHQDGSSLGRVFLSPYQKRTSSRPPEGLLLDVGALPPPAEPGPPVTRDSAAARRRSLAGVTMLLVLGAVQCGAGFQGIEHFFGPWVGLLALAGAVFARFMLPLTIGSYFGATAVWGWHWFPALLLAVPGVLLVPATVACVSEALAARRVR